MLRRRRILPLNFRSSPNPRTRLRRGTPEHFSHQTKNDHQFQALATVQQRPTMGKEKFNIKLRRYHGKLRRIGDFWASGLLPPVATKPNSWHWNRPLPRRRACGTQSNTTGDRESKKRNMPNICEEQSKNHRWSKQESFQLPWCNIRS